MSEPKIIETYHGGQRCWIIEGRAILFSSKRHAETFAQLYPEQTGPWKEAQDIIEREESSRER